MPRPTISLLGGGAAKHPLFFRYHHLPLLENVFEQWWTCWGYAPEEQEIPTDMG